MVKIVFSVMVVIHGLIHLMGFIKAFGLREIGQLTQLISKPLGILWLLTAVAFLVSGLLILRQRDWWWLLALAAVFISQILIFMTWTDTKWGTGANIVILIAVILAYGNWNFNSMVRSELGAFKETGTSQELVSQEMIDTLPPLVQKWMENSQVIGHEMIAVVALKQTGELRTEADGNWMSFEAEQWFETKEPAFIWLADVQAAPGIHLAGRDKYQNGEGHMLIKLLSLVPVADATGYEVNQGSLLRYLAEIIWFPTAALEDYIEWEQIDDQTAKATISYGGITASGIYSFDKQGNVTSFYAKRYYEKDGQYSLEHWLIENDPDSYQVLNGLKIPVKSKVTWKLKESDYTWLKLNLTDIGYNQGAASLN